MSLKKLAFEPVFEPVPVAQENLAADALARAAKLSDLENPDRIPGFVMTPPPMAWGLVQAAQSQLPLGGNSFCEWGAGLGLATFFAERIGFDATGIELEPTLIAQSKELAQAHDLQAQVKQGSYKPDGFWTEGGDIMSDLFDAALTFAYPWPAETQAIPAFFGRHAPKGAILVLYGGGINVTAYQKIA